MQFNDQVRALAALDDEEATRMHAIHVSGLLPATPYGGAVAIGDRRVCWWWASTV
jgi:hypothetical protein